MKSLRLVMRGLCGLIVLFILGCALDKPAPFMVLDAPSNATPQAQALLTEGNRLFREKQWEEARQQFQAAAQAQPDLAEAHYNLGLVMNQMGDRAGAKPHFIRAANLAPGHKVIWNSPPLRKYGNVPDAPVSVGATPAIPGIGGGAGGIGNAGGLGGS